MFEALLKQERKRQRQKNASPIEYKLRSGIIAGATPPRDLLTAIKQTFGLGNLLYPFGSYCIWNHLASLTGLRQSTY